MQPFEQAFIDSILPAAQAAEAQFGVPAAITAAQCILESGWGRYMPAGSNNPFGIKATDLSDPSTYVEAMTTEYSGGKIVHEEQPFEKYPDMATAFTAHAQLLADNPRYAPAMAVKGDVQGFATALMNCGYSTNRPGLAPGPKFYADILMELVTEFNL